MDKKILNNLISFALIVATGVATLAALSFIFPSDSEKTASAPMYEQPVASSTETLSEITFKKLILNAEPYTPSVDVMSNRVSYDNQSIRLILNGDFQTVRLHVVGTTTEKGEHFLNLVYGTSGGILNAYRQSEDTLNIKETQKSGGVFTETSPIDVTLDLLNPIQFASSRTDYLKNQQASKLVNLWQSNLLPPTYINLLVAPFNVGGVYGGAQVTSSIEYSCVEGSDCQAAVCPISQYKYITACMRDKFGAYAARNWCTRAGYQNCSF